MDDFEEREQRILEEQRKLMEELSKVRQERAERFKLEQNNKAVELKVTSFAGAYVTTKGAIRDDILELFRSIPSRRWRGGDENIFELLDWLQLEKKLKMLNNVTISYDKNVRDEIDRHLFAPAWKIEKSHNVLRAIPGPRSNAQAVGAIIGAQWDSVKRWFHIPLSEGWSLHAALENVEGVIWSKEASEFVISQIEARANLDKIGRAKDWEYDPGFINGAQLRPFQRVGCAFVEATQGKALLAYQMGLGKTWMALAYAWKNKFKTLIVCPASLKNNWYREVKNLTGVKSEFLFGAEPTPHTMVDLIMSKNPFTIINYDILGRKKSVTLENTDEQGIKHTSRQDRFFWVEALNMAKYDLVIFDESHYMKTVDANRTIAAQKLTTPRVLHMTGTPVLNRPGELWPMLNMLAPAIFPTYQTFIHQYTYDGKTAKNVNRLQEALRSIMIRRKQEDVVEDMPALNRITDFHELSDDAKARYEKVLAGVYEQVSSYSSRGESGNTNVTNVLVEIQRLKQVCAMDKVDSTAELATELADSASGTKHDKVLIFSQFKPVAFNIAQRLGHEALCFVSRGTDDFITANDVERDRLVQQFQTDPKIKYLVVTEKTAKEGHNITKAGSVIFNDPFWTPAAHEQGEGRAYMRVSDPHGIDAYYRLTDMDGDSIEEWIFNYVLKLKQSVIEQTVEGVEGSRTEGDGVMLIIQKLKERLWTR